MERDKDKASICELRELLLVALAFVVSGAAERLGSVVKSPS